MVLRRRRHRAGPDDGGSTHSGERNAGYTLAADTAAVDRLRSLSLQRAAITLALVLAVTFTGACSRQPKVPPGSLMSSSGALVDFRSMPTRTQVGMDSKGFVTYPHGTGAPPVPTTLVFPDGTIHRDFSAIDIGTNYAFAPDADERHQPTDFDFYLKASSITEARAMLREDAAALGLSPKEVADITSQGTSVEQGLVKSWLSTEVEARASGNADGSMNLIYSVTIGRYHNEAVDKVLHHGRMHLDLTTRPSPADLAFQDAYDDADITPEFGHQLRISLTTPRGRITLPADSFTSSRTNGTVKTTIFTGLLDLTDSPTTARASAKVLGFDVAPALEIIRTANATLQTRYLECASTDVYTCAIRVQTVDDGTPHYGFIYRVTLTYR